MKKTRPWVAFYSHTGDEIVNVARELGIYPNLVCTNNVTVNSLLGGQSVFKPEWTEHDYREILSRYHYDTPVVTLHGWMRIIPAQICDEFEIYNGHPALISEYPELKGKDKQEDVINQVEKYPYIGSVIHKCSPIVDDGEIQVEERVHNICVRDRALIYQILKDTSLRTWLDFLPTIL